MSTTERITNWNKAHKIAREIRKIEREYIGCEVLESHPVSKTNYAVAVITHMRWEASVYNPVDRTDGDWLVGIRYLHDGSQSWTNCHTLVLTGVKYEDVNAVVKLNPMYVSIWG